jgi:uncharacterized protein YqeY
MSTIESQIKTDIKEAMKAHRKDELEVLRMLMSDAKNVAIDAGLDRTGVDDDTFLKVLRKGVKTRTESADMYREAARTDLEEKERFQIEVLRKYMPAELSEAELEVIVDTVIVELGATSKKEMGGVMKEVMMRTGGRCDGRKVSAIVGTRLS